MGDIDIGDGCWRPNVLVTSLRCLKNDDNVIIFQLCYSQFFSFLLKSYQNKTFFNKQTPLKFN